MLSFVERDAFRPMRPLRTHLRKLTFRRRDSLDTPTVGRRIKSMRFGRYLGLKHEDTLERAGKAGRLQAEQASYRENPKSFVKRFKRFREEES